MHAYYEVYISYGSKVIANVKVDNRQTLRQDKNNMPPIIRHGGIKTLNGFHIRYMYIIFVTLTKVVHITDMNK